LRKKREGRLKPGRGGKHHKAFCEVRETRAKGDGKAVDKVKETIGESRLLKGRDLAKRGEFSQEETLGQGNCQKEGELIKVKKGRGKREAVNEGEARERKEKTGNDGSAVPKLMKFWDQGGGGPERERGEKCLHLMILCGSRKRNLEGGKGEKRSTGERKRGTE